MQAGEDVAGAVLALDREVGAGDVADEQRVAGQHRPGLAAAGAIDEREGGVLGPVARRVQGADDDVAELELPAVVERLVVVFGLGEAMDVDRRARREREAAMARDVVGVVVRLEDVLDSDTHVPCKVQIDIDLEARIDDRGDLSAVIADQIGRAAEIVVGDLAKEHAGNIQRPPTPDLRGS